MRKDTEASQMGKHVGLRGPVAALLAAIVLATACAAAGADRGADDNRMTPEEIDQQFKALSAKGWTRPGMGEALGITRGDRHLFNVYVGLIDKKVPPSLIERSFIVCKGDVATVSEYWKWITEHKFSSREVEQVFAGFPNVQMTRYFYFSYRAGGPAGLAARASATSPADIAKVHGYSAGECAAIFRACRFDMQYVKAYFDIGAEGKPPAEAWAPVKETILADLKLRQEEEQKKAEEARKEAEEKRRKAEELRQLTGVPDKGDPGADDGGKGGGAVRISVDDLDRLLFGEDDDGAEDDKEPGQDEEPAKTDADDQPAGDDAAPEETDPAEDEPHDNAGDPPDQEAPQDDEQT